MVSPPEKTWANRDPETLVNALSTLNQKRSTSHQLCSLQIAFSHNFSLLYVQKSELRASKRTNSSTRIGTDFGKGVPILKSDFAAPSLLPVLDRSPMTLTCVLRRKLRIPHHELEYIKGFSLHTKRLSRPCRHVCHATLAVSRKRLKLICSAQCCLDLLARPSSTRGIETREAHKQNFQFESPWQCIWGLQ